MTVPDEAVEAAVASWFAGIGERTYIDAMREALEAAAPFIAAQAWDEGRAAGSESIRQENPYRSRT